MNLCKNKKQQFFFYFKNQQSCLAVLQALGLKIKAKANWLFKCENVALARCMLSKVCQSGARIEASGSERDAL